MTGPRARDRLIGALAMLVVLAVAFAIAWWALTEPPGTSPTSDRRDSPVSGEGGRPSGAQAPPADLTAEEVWLADMDLDAGLVALPESTLLDVSAVGEGVRSGPAGLVADWLSVEATVPFEDIETELGGDTRVRAADEGGQAMVVRTVEVVGRDLTVMATGTVEVVDGLLVVEPRSIDLGGPDFLSRRTADLVRRFVTIEHAIEGLPQGLTLLDVDVQDGGFRAVLEGQDVVLVEGAGR